MKPRNVIFSLFISAVAIQTVFPVYAELKKQHSVNAKTAVNFVPNKKIPIEGAKFLMGNSAGEADERPAHEVTIGSFSIDEHEVTNSEYEACVKSGNCAPAHYDDGHCNVMTESGWWEGLAPSVFRDWNKPVTCVNYDEAATYCKWKGGRLPTEAEFEYALRARTKSRYYWGENAEAGVEYSNGADIDGKKVFEGVYANRFPMYVNGHDGNVYTAPVKSYRPNGFGLYDMTGNAWEWCYDWYKNYDPRSNDNPVGPDTGTHRVVRGGGAESNPDHLISTYRDRSLPFYRALYTGFRCVYKQ